MSENSKFFYIYKSEFHFVKMAIKATNKSATTRTILMSTVSMQCTKCHSNRIMLNEQQYYYPQQLKEFLQEKVSHLFYGLEVSINCNVSLYVYSTQTVIWSKLSSKIVMSTITSHNFMDVNKLNPHQVEFFFNPQKMTVWLYRLVYPFVRYIVTY